MVEPVVTGIATKIISSLLADGIKQAALSLKKYYSESDFLVIPDRVELSKIATVVDHVIDDDTAISPEVKKFLRSPECITLLEHTFAYRIAGRAVTSDGPLYYELKNMGGLYGLTDELLLDRTFSILSGVVSLVLRMADVRRDEDLSLAGRDQASSAVIETTLAAIEGHVRTLSQPSVDSIESRREVLRIYREAVAAVLGRIQPPSFDGARNVPIDSLYVTPRLEIGNSSREVISIESCVANSRVVVLGDPGGGKTTLAKKIASSLASGTLGASRGNAQIVPFVVVLRDYGAALLANPMSIAQFIAVTAQTNFQVELPLPVIEWVLATGQAYVIFDGLDELLKTDNRRRIADAITAFSVRYPNLSVLVTSRRVGYMQAPLPEESFTVVKLGDLDQKQVSKYVENWFALETSLSPHDSARLKTAFLTESRILRDLRSNPLMLALMCTIYRMEGYIPRNRPDMYEKCSRMLFDRWDRHRGLLEPFEFEAHVEPALMYIANSIFRDEKLQAGVPESYLVELATDYLHKWQYADISRAANAAQKFIEFCRGRAWIFTDVGLDANDRALFQFTHRTFLEYFTAAYLARVSSTLEELITTLTPRILRGEWDVVAQLALQIRAKPIEGGPDLVVRTLVAAMDSITIEDGALGDVVQFVARCLTFMIISPPVVAEVARSLVRHSIDLAMNGREMSARDSLRTVRSAAIETRDAITSEIVIDFSDRLEKTSQRELPYVSGLAWSFNNRVVDGSSPASGRLAGLEEKLNSILVGNTSWPWAASTLFEQGRISGRELVSSVGSGMLTSNYEIPGIKTYLYSPVLRSLQHFLYTACDEPDRCADFAHVVVSAAAYIESFNGQEVIDRRSQSSIEPEYFFDGRRSGRRRPHASDVGPVALALVMAWFLELASVSRQKMILNKLSRTRLRSMAPLLRARFDQKASTVEVEINEPGWLHLLAWSRSEVDLVKITGDVVPPF